jgi:hypothetical protein
MRAAVDWLLASICVLVYGLLIAEAVGVVRHILAIRRRVERLTELRMFGALARAGTSAETLGNAALEGAALAARARSALVRIRAMLNAALALVLRRLS